MRVHHKSRLMQTNTLERSLLVLSYSINMPLKATLLHISVHRACRGHLSAASHKQNPDFRPKVRPTILTVNFPLDCASREETLRHPATTRRLKGRQMTLVMRRKVPLVSRSVREASRSQQRAAPTQQAFIEVDPHADVLRGRCRRKLGHRVFGPWFQRVGLSLWRRTSVN